MKKQTDFATKQEFFQYLVANKTEMADFKKSALKFTDAFGINILQARAVKSLNTSYQDDVKSGTIKRTIIGNTYNYMDSQSDVLLDNCFEKSISENQDKIWHLHDHEQKITAKVGRPEKIYEKAVDWADLGVEKVGQTMALFMDSNIIKDFNPIVFEQYLSKEINQHSVGMRYISLELAVNDSSQKEEYAVWTKYIDRIGNKAHVEEQGFFWAIKQGELIEISCVLAGSNSLTPTVENEKAEEKAQREKTEKAQREQSFYYKITKALTS